MDFNIIATIGTTEVELAPYPNGSATTPVDKIRKIYTIILTNTSVSSNTLTLNIYKGTTLEKSFSIIIPASSSLTITNEKKSPILLIPSNRTLKGIAEATSIHVLMAGYDE